MKMILQKYVSTALVMTLTACAMGPDYVRPNPILQSEMPSAFKEDWKIAEPQDHAIPTNWWTIFNDENLNALIEQVATANLTVAQAEANYRQAAALLDNAKAAYFPQVTGDVTRKREKNSANSTTISTSNSASITVGWELDMWGAIRRAVEAQDNAALSSLINVDATRLSMQSQLAQTYFQLRVLDAQKELFDRTVGEYQRALTLTERQYKSGIVAADSVLQAQTQLESTQAQALNLGIQRAQFEHAIAVLIGKAPSAFSISPIPIGQRAYMPEMPDIPVAVPSSLLERRPDVAASERSVASANAQIGVTKAALFPTLSLGATGGFQSSSFAHLLSLPNRFWSIGPDLAATIFDGGAKRALNRQAIATYDANVAAYRQTILTAFQNVEDNLAALRILKEEYAKQNSAAISARKALNIAMSQYKAGTVNYLSVVTAQTTALTNERAELTITSSRLVAAVQLIAAMGGGWTGIENADKVAAVNSKNN